MISDRILDGFQAVLGALFGSRNERIIKSLIPIAEQVNLFADQFDRLSDDQLRSKTDEFKQRLQAGETLDHLLPEAFGAVKSACRRLVGKRWLVCNQEKLWNDVPFDVQIMGAVVLHQGKIAEMVTGEGKTLVATMPAYLNALTGKSVHIVTVNDYLARRDRDWMGPVYEMLGMTAGALQSHILDPAVKRQIYACDIVYGQNSEFGFDYLRDNMAWSLEGQCQSELFYAIIDEVDSILIDEARTPHISSGPALETAKEYAIAERIARRLKKGPTDVPPDLPDDEKSWDYEVKEKENNVVITARGRKRAAEVLNLKAEDEFTTPGSPFFGFPDHRLRQALRARELFLRDKDYVVQGDEVVIVDPFTGRLQPGRRWSDGLHQAIEAKEKIYIKEENETLATITLQKFFQLYEKIAGMTGTAITEATEFWEIYKLDVVQIPTDRPLIRTAYPDVVLLTQDEKQNLIVEEIEQVHAVGRPLLVGTRSIEKSEKLAEMLKARGIEPQVLNARHHEREALIVARAGEFARVTISTQMAGRGTDIVLGRMTIPEVLEHWKAQGLAPKELRADLPRQELEEKLIRFWASKFLNGEKLDAASLEELRQNLERYWKEMGQAPLRLCESVAELGGLHILGTERDEARRIDNQLRGRAGRQGDPGSSRYFIAIEDDLMRIFAGPRMRGFLANMGMGDGIPITSKMVTRQIEKAQKRVEDHNFQIRKNLLDFDEVNDQQRKEIYSQRQEILEGKDLKDMVWRMIEMVVADALETYMGPKQPEAEWDREGLRRWANQKFNLRILKHQLQDKKPDEIEKLLLEHIDEHYKSREQELGEEKMRTVERFVLLYTIDNKWKAHLQELDEIHDTVLHRWVGQKDPKLEYKREAFAEFENMVYAIYNEVTDLIFKVGLQEAPLELAASVYNPQEFQHAAFSSFEAQKQAALAASHQMDEKPEPFIRTGIRVGRNDPCPCGSGKKFKRCCGRNP